MSEKLSGNLSLSRKVSLKIRPEHKSRLVKLYSNDENGQTFPVFTFVWPINPTKILDSPRLAHRLVSSFELELIADRGIAGQVDIWTSASGIVFSIELSSDPNVEIEISGKSIFEIQIQNFCYIQVIDYN